MDDDGFQLEIPLGKPTLSETRTSEGPPGLGWAAPAAEAGRAAAGEGREGVTRLWLESGKFPSGRAWSEITASYFSMSEQFGNGGLRSWQPD